MRLREKIWLWHECRVIFYTKRVGLIVVSVLIMAAGRSVNADSAGTCYTNTIARMTAHITGQMETEKIVGLGIAVVDGDEIVWERGFGYADREAGVSVSNNTVFRIGSVSKVFGTASVLTLVDDGLVDLDAPVTNYIPDFVVLPRYDDVRPITVRMLLSHQSGLPGDIVAGMFTVEPVPGFLDWLTAYLRTDYPAYPPMFVSVYCNTGFVLAEGVVRAASGAPFIDYAEKAVFNRLGMSFSTFKYDHPAVLNKLAHPYINGVRVPDEQVGGYATGGMYASMPDLTRFLRMVNSGGVFEGNRFISTNSLAEMTRDNSGDCPMNLNSSWLCGLGWDFVRYDEMDYAGRAWVKSGGTLGYTAYIAALPDQDLGVAVAINSRSGTLMNTLFETLRRAVLDKTGVHWPTNTFIPPDSPVTNRPQNELEAMAGFYVSAHRFDSIIAEESGTLTWVQGVFTEEPVVTTNLVPRANGWFSLPDSRDLEITVTNVTGTSETVLLARYVQGPYQRTALTGQRYTPSTIPSAWTERVDTIYLVDDMHPLDYLRLANADYGIRFFVNSDVLSFASDFGSGYLDPADDDTAFVLGLQNRGPAAVQAMRVNGVEKLQFGGCTFVDADSVPALQAGSGTAGVLPDALLTAWYRVPVRCGFNYVFRIESPDGCSLTVCDTDAGFITSLNADDSFRWLAEKEGCAFIGVYGDGYTAGSYSISVDAVNGSVRDFNGDGRSDFVVFHQNTGLWYALSSDMTEVLAWSLAFGSSGWWPLADDFNGDGKSDFAVFDQNTGRWYVLSSDMTEVLTWGLEFGMPDAWPVTGDFNGDGRIDYGVFDQSTGLWYILDSDKTTVLAWGLQFGWPGARPLIGDFNGDDVTDIGVYDQSTGSWYIRGLEEMLQWGGPGYVAVPGDFNGDGMSDYGVYDLTSGKWYVLGADRKTVIAWGLEFGMPGAQPVTGDYNGDGKSDFAVFDKDTGKWYVLSSDKTTVLVWYLEFGWPGALPIGAFCDI